MMEYWLIGLTVAHGVIFLFKLFLFLEYRNIYTQKIMYLNNCLSEVKNLENFELSSFHEFKIARTGDIDYPPSIVEKYLRNPTYSQLIESFNKRRSNLKLLGRNLIFSYLFILVISWLIHIVTSN